MKHIGIIIAAALSLTACQNKPQAESALKTACVIAQVGSSAFDAYVAAKPGRVDAAGLRWKAGVVAAIKPICANPAAVSDPAQALDTVVKIGFALSDFIAGVDSGRAP